MTEERVGVSGLRVGTFIKTPAPHIVELLGLAKLDFAVIDAEHGPFDRTAIDVMMLASRASGLPLIVRIPDHQPSTIMWALDLGAAGIVVPHVDDVEQARSVVHAAKYLVGSRGYSNGPRAAGYGTRSTTDVIRTGNDTKVICQIESATAVEQVEAIAEVAGVDGLLIGRADLALSCGLTDFGDHRIAEATARSLRAARGAGKGAAIVTGSAAELPVFRQMGATIAIVGSDQSLLRTSVATMVEAVRALDAMQPELIGAQA